MNKSTVLIIGIDAIILMIGWLLDPALTVLGGIILIIILSLTIVGGEEGNKYKTMAMTRVPDFLEVRTFMRQKDVQNEPRPRINLVLVLLISGASLIGIGLYWMHRAGVL